MADNITIPQAIVASDDIGGVQFQRVKIAWGADGVGNDTNAATPLPTAQTGALPAGSNNIGDVDVLTLPALPAGANTIGNVGLVAGTANIGDVDVLTMPAIPAGGNLIGNVASALRATSNGLTTSRVVSAAGTNATLLKASAGTIARIDLFNTSASMRYVRFYNMTAAPTVGDSTILWTIPIPAGSGWGDDFQYGEHFSAGIAYSITGGAADTDTTIVAAGDITGKISWL